MVFSSYSNTSYLPLDSEQGVTFYKNENLLFPLPPAAAATAAAVASPSTLVCRRNTAAAAAAMLTASTGSSPFGSQPLHHGSSQHGNVCDDFQPVAHLSSNGYYGYVPANTMPKVMSTEGTPPAAVPPCNGSGVGVLLDCHPVAASGADSSSSMMDCGGGGLGEVENYHHLQLQQQQQQQHLRKRKEYSEEGEVNCKRRKTWLEEQPHDAGFIQTPNWQQAPPVQQMECHDQPMDTFAAHQFNGSPVTMNAVTTTSFNGFHHHHPHHQTLMTSPPMPATPQPPTVLQPKSKYTDTSRCMMSHMI